MSAASRISQIPPLDPRSSLSAHATVIIYPIGVPVLFWYLLRVRFRGILEKQSDKEQLAVETKQAAKHVDRLHKRRSSASQQLSTPAPLSRHASVGREVVRALQKTDLTRLSSVSDTTEPSEDTKVGFGTTAVWKETTSVLGEREAAFLGFLLNPYLLSCFWQRRESNHP